MPMIGMSTNQHWASHGTSYLHFYTFPAPNATLAYTAITARRGGGQTNVGNEAEIVGYYRQLSGGSQGFSYFPFAYPTRYPSSVAVNNISGILFALDASNVYSEALVAVTYWG